MQIGLLRHLFLGLLRGELEVQIHFQPIAELEGGAVTGYEALCRFPAVFGAPPDVCFAEARSLGLGREVESMVFQQTLEIRNHLPRNCFLSVNISPEFLVSGMCDALAGHPDLTGLVFEVTEEASITDYTAVRQCLADVRRRGAMIAVDDAGSGYASLNHILEIKPEFIKIDRRIVQNCHLDRAKSTLIEMLGAAANRMDAWILAEGIECAGELEELILLGVPLAQGYFLGKPFAAMADIPEEASRILSRRPHASEIPSLLGIFCASPGYPHLESATWALQESSEQTVAVVIDRWQRPVQVLHRHPLLGLRLLPAFLRVQLASEPLEVLQRTMLRPPECRFDPVILISPEGHFLGFLEIDRLLNSVLGSPFPKAGLSKDRRLAARTPHPLQ